MFEMIHVVERSDTGYSDAVQRAVTQLVDAGRKVHFFEVVEQRGAVRNGDIEYQVKVAVACEPVP